MKKNALWMLVIWVICFSIGFSSNFRIALESYLQKSPLMVIAELQWQNAQDIYNAQLVRATTKMDILAADIQRFDRLEEYRTAKWEQAFHFMEKIMEWKRIQSEVSLIESQLKLAQEDVTNKQRALSFGGVSQDDVQLAVLTLEASQTMYDHSIARKVRIEHYLKTHLFLTQPFILALQLPEIQPLYGEQMVQAISQTAQAQTLKLQKEQEESQHSLLATGGSSSYQTEIARRNARARDLELAVFLIQSEITIHESFEMIHVAFSLLDTGNKQRQVLQNQSERIQEGFRKGVLSTREYYEHLIRLYQYELKQIDLELQAIQAMKLLLPWISQDPVGALNQWVR